MGSVSAAERNFLSFMLNLINFDHSRAAWHAPLAPSKNVLFGLLLSRGNC